MLNGLNGATVSEILTPQNGDDLIDDCPRLVLDTNTVLALWMFRDPKLDKLRAWIEAGNCRLYSREDALEELRRVLAYRQFALDANAQRDLFVNYCGRVEHSVAGRTAATRSSLMLIPRCRDTDDQKFLQLASERRADVLVTRDKALLSLRRALRSKVGCSIVQPEVLSEALDAHGGNITALDIRIS